MSDAQKALAAQLLPFFASAAEQSRERTLALARQQHAVQAPTELLSFVVGQERYALPLAQVQEICRIQQLTAVPRTRPETLGIMALRGEVVPVVDLAAILGLGHSGASALAVCAAQPLRAIVLCDGRGPLALHVREVKGVVRLSPQDITPKPYNLAIEHPELMVSLGRTAKGMVTVLDGPALLRHLEQLP